MSPTFEHIKKEISTLPVAERLSLWRELSAEFDTSVAGNDDEKMVEAAWDQEMAGRIKQVENGAVELLSAEEVEKRQEVLFAELGLVRKAYTA